MRHALAALGFGLFLAFAAPARAGLYYSGETYAELPSQWRGFLVDQRMLRTIAFKPVGTASPSPARTRYENEAAKLVKLTRERKLTADEAADLGAIYVRLGDFGKAIEVLGPAQREHPSHFRLSANLGTAWQLNGDLTQAVSALQQAVRLAPGKSLKAEELHLKLVRQRAKQGARCRISTISLVSNSSGRAGSTNLVDWRSRNAKPCRRMRSHWRSSWLSGCLKTHAYYGSSPSWPMLMATSPPRRRSWMGA